MIGATAASDRADAAFDSRTVQYTVAESREGESNVAILYPEIRDLRRAGLDGAEKTVKNIAAVPFFADMYMLDLRCYSCTQRLSPPLQRGHSIDTYSTGRAFTYERRPFALLMTRAKATPSVCGPTRI